MNLKITVKKKFLQNAEFSVFYFDSVKFSKNSAKIKLFFNTIYTLYIIFLDKYQILTQ